MVYIHGVLDFPGAVVVYELVGDDSEHVAHRKALIGKADLLFKILVKQAVNIHSAGVVGQVKVAVGGVDHAGDGTGDQIAVGILALGKQLGDGDGLGIAAAAAAARSLIDCHGGQRCAFKVDAGAGDIAHSAVEAHIFCAGCALVGGHGHFDGGIALAFGGFNTDPLGSGCSPGAVGGDCHIKSLAGCRHLLIVGADGDIAGHRAGYIVLCAGGQGAQAHDCGQQ